MPSNGGSCLPQSGPRAGDFQRAAQLFDVLDEIGADADVIDANQVAHVDQVIDPLFDGGGLVGDEARDGGQADHPTAGGDGLQHVVRHIARMVT